MLQASPPSLMSLLHYVLLIKLFLIIIGTNIQIYCWPLLYTVFSEVLSAKEWMILMDHVLSNHPGNFYNISIIFVLCLLV